MHSDEKKEVKKASDHSDGCLHKLCNSALHLSHVTFIFIPLYTIDCLKANSFSVLNMKKQHQHTTSFSTIEWLFSALIFLLADVRP